MNLHFHGFYSPKIEDEHAVILKDTFKCLFVKAF